MGKSKKLGALRQRADPKRHGYEPHPEAVFFEELPAVVGKDEQCCFWGANRLVQARCQKACARCNGYPGMVTENPH
jgi:hypothetical protein